MVSSGYPDSPEKQLRQRSQPGSSNMLDYCSAAVIIWNKNGEVLSANRAAALLFGYSKEELLKKQASFLFHTKDASGHPLFFPESGNAQVPATLIAVTGQGAYIPCSVQSMPFSQEELTGTSTTIIPISFYDKSNTASPEKKISPVGVDNGRKARLETLMNDISEKERMESGLKQAYDRFQNMLRATNDMIWDWDLEEGTFYRNPEGVKKVYGVSDNNRIRRLGSWLKRVHPDDRRTVQKAIKKALQVSHCDTFEVEYRFKRDDSTYAFIYDRGIVLRNEEGRPLRVVGAAQNITDRKKLEQELLQKELEKQKQISRASIDIQERERREIGNDLHDNVNQMLTTIKLYLDISLTDPLLKDDLIRKASGTVLQVINEIRHLSRSLMDPSIRDLGLLDALDDYIQSINTNRELLVSLNATTSVEHLLADDQKLMVFRIVQEALNNSLKHAQATAAHIDLKESKDGIILTIIDDGKGFTPITKRGGGLKNIENRVYLAAGTFAIRSAPGRGCKIIINFPIQQKHNPD